MGGVLAAQIACSTATAQASIAERGEVAGQSGRHDLEGWAEIGWEERLPSLPVLQGE